MSRCPASGAKGRPDIARPTKYSEQREALILNALRAGNTRKAASAYAGIDQDTFSAWMKRYSDFSDAVKKSEADAEVRHVANVAKAAGEGIWTASAWWLERRRSEDWGRKERVDIIATVRIMAQQAGLSDEETVAAVAEAERYLQEVKRAAAR